MICRVIELAILGVLADQDLHGYEIRKRLKDEGVVMTLSFGSLYPALARLERQGALETLRPSVPGQPGSDSAPSPAGSVTTSAARHIPLTGSLTGERQAAFLATAPASRSGRSRKVYHITEKGRQLFGELMSEEQASARDQREFDIRLAFARHLPPPARIRLLERRRIQLATRLQEIEAAERAASHRPAGYGARLLAHEIDTLKRDIGWLDKLIDDEHPRAGLINSPKKGEAR